MGRELGKMILFILLVTGFYTYFANSIPQMESQPPEELTIIRGEELSPQELVRLGEKIFYGRGVCAVCHAIGQKGERCPDLEGIGWRAAGRVAGKTGKEYLIESLISPEAYLVEGYGKIMPLVNEPPISLNQTEILATVAFLQSLGEEVTVKPEDLLKISPVVEAPLPAAPVIVGDPTKGQQVFYSKGCVACHKIEGVGGVLGPDLTNIGAINTEEYIRESILNPGAKLVRGYQPIMPPDFAEKMTVKEFNDLVSFLISLRGT